MSEKMERRETASGIVIRPLTVKDLHAHGQRPYLLIILDFFLNLIL